MSENQSVLLLRDGALFWLEPGAEVARSVHSDEDRQALAQQLAKRGHGHVFAVPGADVRLLEIDIAKEERRHLDGSLPFMLEETLSEDIEELHFAKVPLGADRYSVAVVRKACMHSWKAALADLAENIDWIPEPLLLPWQAGEWTILLEGESALLRFGQGEGTRIERDLLPSLLSALGQTVEVQRVLVYGDNEEKDTAQVSACVSAPIEWRRGSLGTTLLLGGATASTVRLLQGEFAPRLPFDRWWQQWRMVAAVLLLAVVADGLTAWLDYRHLERENLALRTEMQGIYRRVNPRGAVSDIEKQLNGQLRALRGDGGNGSFLTLLAPLSDAFPKSGEMNLASLTYSQRSEEIRVNINAPSFDAVEALRTRLNTGGLVATMESSSRSGDRVRARLRMESQP